MMVYLELKSSDDGLVVYDYMPESEGAPRGTVAVNAATGARKVVGRSRMDEYSVYLSHAFKRIDEMLAEGVLRQKTYAAWY